MSVPLEPAGVVQLLLDRGLLGASALHGDTVRVSDVSRRHHNLRVETRRHGAYLVKQAVSERTRAALAAEGEALLRLGSDGASLARHLPRLVAFDRARGLLVLALESRAESLRAHHGRTRALTSSTGAAVARALAAVHRAGHDVLRAGEVPGAVRLHRPPLGLVRDMSPACVELVRIVQGDTGLRDGLRGLDESWAPLACTHGDMRWDNVLLAGAHRPGRVVLVDWELAAAGDPRWDVGCVLASALALWVEMMPAAPGLRSAEAASLSAVPLALLRDGLASFVLAWERATGLPAVEQPATRATVMRVAAARLLQLAYESVAARPQLTATAVLEIQLAANMMAAPEVATSMLLGLRT